MLWLKWLVTCLSLWRPRLDPRPVCVWFWWTKWYWDGFFSEYFCFSLSVSFCYCSILIHLPHTLYNVSLPVLQYSPVSIIPPLLHTRWFIYHTHCIMFLSQYFTFPPSVSFHHCSILIHLPLMLYNVHLPVHQFSVSIIPPVCGSGKTTTKICCIWQVTDTTKLTCFFFLTSLGQKLAVALLFNILSYKNLNVKQCWQKKHMFWLSFLISFCPYICHPRLGKFSFNYIWTHALCFSIPCHKYQHCRGGNLWNG